MPWPGSAGPLTVRRRRSSGPLRCPFVDSPVHLGQALLIVRSVRIGFEEVVAQLSSLEMRTAQPSATDFTETPRAQAFGRFDR